MIGANLTEDPITRADWFWSQSHRAEWGQNRRLDVPEVGSPGALAVIAVGAAVVHSPANSAVTVVSWEAIARECAVNSTLSGSLREAWFAASRVAAGGTTGQYADQIKSIPGPLRETTQPWYDEEGMEGMRQAIEEMKKEALRLEPRAQFSEPVVERVGDDDGLELALVVIDAYIPRESDGMEFRDRFFGRLTDLLPRWDRARLAVGVGRLGPTA